ncbi:MAG TPA: class I SAM-dependent methyltransferase [Candidatus Limnocylindrales bacterium]|nr:class I SAM-dependent methyltransferase [Candidatus Limnocylindrales bacterium]
MNGPRPLPGPEVYAGVESLGLDVDRQTWDSTDSPIFAEMIAETQPRTIVEVGSWKGCSAIKMAELTEHLGTKIYCVDTWLASPEHFVRANVDYKFPVSAQGRPLLYEQFLVNVKAAGYADRIIPILNTSHNGAQILKFHSVTAELIFIDGCHDYYPCFADIEQYWPMLTPGVGQMFGDDFRTFPGVFHAVLRFSHERGAKFRESGKHWVMKP